MDVVARSIAAKAVDNVSSEGFILLELSEGQKRMIANSPYASGGSASGLYYIGAQDALNVKSLSGKSLGR